MSDIEARTLEKSRITGDLEASTGAKIRFRLFESRWQWVGTLFWSFVTAALTIGYVTWLIINFSSLDTLGTAPLFVPIAVVALANEIIRMPLIITLCITSLTARKPVATQYEGEINAVLLITFVPLSEDLLQLRQVLIAAKAINTVNGRTTILVLDEGIPGEPENESQVRFLVDALNGMYDGNHIEYFSRSEIRRFNKSDRYKSHGWKRGSFASRTKHGNINSGLVYIKENPDIFGDVDVVMGLDPDHVPVPEFRERMIGPFRNPNVGYVIGPQAYKNATDNYIARFNESAQSVFHTLIQSSANLQGAAMLVGTSYAIRWSTLMQINGIQPSITEDLLTTSAVLSARNPKTNKYWRGIYTPDVLAHGEGPDRWGSTIQQQLRWALGAMRFIATGTFFKSLWLMRGHPSAMLHYIMIMPFYFIMALSWLLAAANIGLQMTTGLSGAVVDPGGWAMFYAFVMISSLYLYTRMRRFNVSPFEDKDFGVRGMVMGVMCAPVFAHAMFRLIPSLLGRGGGFNVTPKGTKSHVDTWYTFRLQLGWMAYYIVIFAFGLLLGHLNPINLAWALIPMLILALPILLWVTRRDKAEWKQYKRDKKTDRKWRMARNKVQKQRDKVEGIKILAQTTLDDRLFRGNK